MSAEERGTVIVRGRSLITRTISRTACEEIRDGALLIEDGVISEVDSFAALQSRHPRTRVIGSGNDVVLPGFVNAHHHIGLTPRQLGSPDMPLELWFVTRMALRNVDPYLDTLYSAFEMIGSGVTTVQHIQSVLPGTLDEVEGKCNDVIRAYEDIGMRVSYCYSIRDQNRLVYQADDAFVASLPASVRGPAQRWFDRIKVSLDGSLELFRRLHERHATKQRVKIQLAPANLHWCSDAALTALSDTAQKFDAPMHMHLLETACQKAYAEHRGACSAVDYIERFGMLGPNMTLGHGVWLNERDIERVADTGTRICHNCSSNYRLRSGVAALNQFEAMGIETAIGIDEAGINDDRDMLQEMRMVLNAHRVPGLEEADVPTIPQVLRMATVGGARTTPYGDKIGTLDVGKAADLVMLDWDQVAYPYLDALTSTLDAVVHRAKTSGVKTVMCDGEVLYQDGTFTRTNRTETLRAIHDDLARALADDELERRSLSKALLPHARAFYADYTDMNRHEPFYRQSSRR